MLTIKQALAKAVQILSESDTDTPALDAGVILCYVLNKTMLFVYTSGKTEITQHEEKQYFENIYKRKNGMPVKYIIGCQEFMSLEFVVTPDVLIPRADTEILVQHVINYVNNSSLNAAKEITILDIGTGSGCIAVSLACYLENAKVYALDVSPHAVEIARINAENNGVLKKVEFIEADIMQGLTNCISDKYLPVDIIVSNPPYIPSKCIQTLPVSVREYEPLTALDGGKDGLDFYRRIITEAPACLKQRGFVAVEVGAGQSESVAEMMQSFGQYTNISFIKDLGGIQRVVSGEISHSKDGLILRSEGS